MESDNRLISFKKEHAHEKDMGLRTITTHTIEEKIKANG